MHYKGYFRKEWFNYVQVFTSSKMNPYEILGLEIGADKDQIKKAYAKLIRKYTSQDSPEKFKKIREAYEYLQDENNRYQLEKYKEIPEIFKSSYIQILEYMRKGNYEYSIELCEYIWICCRLRFCCILTNAKWKGIIFIELNNLISDKKIN